MSGSPATSAAATTPKIGWVRKNAESALGRYRRSSDRFTTKLNPEISTPCYAIDPASRSPQRVGAGSTRKDTTTKTAVPTIA